MRLKFWRFWIEANKIKRVLAIILLSALPFVVWFIRESNGVLDQDMSSWSISRAADCGIVLTGGAGRVREGFSLLAQGLIKKLIISGVHEDVRLRDLLPQKAFYGDLQESDIVLERRSGTTYGNAQQSLPFIEAFHCRDILLITSRSHMYRSLRTFRATLPDEFLIFPHPVVAGRFRPDFSEVSQEALKSMFYRLWAY